ncbi:Sterol desaturase/sphingolipid hydroxylase, fatty acid hydroxylase superfamily [Arenibacter nanhaiticus]|uniref:Sterol desaturase/sphingolipid hydroxylase, fatty acid hydroxylase superfamily n=1 Tax=Arenibacter nanhaiticus TaxID=558155 RepID=A0A1M6DNW2_9FLAO|nr:sterol desaturase family protein [Arenibacter nanhaiticus]SHI74944.1 Sterol desaturase/sphingolipid hydroxylase, fatty acid hydroxylase superfamily [Arenibacter nanhaiticus]
MDILQTLYNEIIGFLGVSQVWEILKTGNYSSFTTYEGIVALIYPIIPLLILLEFILGLVYKKPQTKVYKVNFLIYIFNRFIGRFIAIAMVVLIIGALQSYALFQTEMTWYWFIYGYIIWEFGHFIYHYLGHKVRLFWCLHSTHHAPEEMNLSVTHAHFFLEAPYADTIRTTVCILLGVDPALLFLIMFIDGTYGAFIHVGENLMKNGRMGFLNKIILTPSHHRVHHAKNPLYMDTNFCNLLNIWDKLFGTYQNEEADIAIEYGITREINSGNFLDVYFGEFVALFKDIARAPGLKNKLLYTVMPPGWSHTGEHQTAKIVRNAHLQQNIPSQKKVAKV